MAKSLGDVNYRRRPASTSRPGQQDPFDDLQMFTAGNVWISSIVLEENHESCCWLLRHTCGAAFSTGSASLLVLSPHWESFSTFFFCWKPLSLLGHSLVIWGVFFFPRLWERASIAAAEQFFLFFFECIYYNCSCWGKCGRWRVMSLTLLSRWDMKCCVFMQFNCLFEAEDYQNPIYLYLNLLAFFPPESYYVVDQNFLLS